MDQIVQEMIDEDKALEMISNSSKLGLNEVQVIDLIEKSQMDKSSII